MDVVFKKQNKTNLNNGVCNTDEARPSSKLKADQRLKFRSVFCEHIGTRQNHFKCPLSPSLSAPVDTWNYERPSFAS